MGREQVLNKTSMIFDFWSQAQKAIFMIKNQFTHISFKILPYFVVV